MLDFFRARATLGVEEIVGDGYRRTVMIGDHAAVISVAPTSKAGCLALRVDPEMAPDAAPSLVIRVRRMFDLDADPAVIDATLARDPALASFVRSTPGLRVPKAWDAFELVVRAILGQQVSVKGATTIAGRLARGYGRPLPTPVGSLSHLFPEPAALATAPLEEIGLTRARASTLRGLASAVTSGAVTLDVSGDREQTITRLMALRGIGPWTAQYVRLRAFADADAFPAGDLGLRRALESGGVLPSERELERISERWRPWRAYAALHLWTGARTTGAREP